MAKLTRDEFISALKEMTILEVKELVDAMKEEFGVDPSAVAVEHGAAALAPGAFNWLGLILVCFVLPGVISWGLGLLLRKAGWIKERDLLLS